MAVQQKPFWQRAVLLVGVSLLQAHELDTMTHEEREVSSIPN